MKNIFTIFKSDIRGLFKNFLALVVAVGLCALPALYAWFNIYANWDPYSNTGNIKIAVANEDKGYTYDSDVFLSMGDDIVELLKGKDSIGWTFVESEAVAKAGVESGQYYAAIVFPEDFTKDIYNDAFESGERPSFKYYVNGKKNAVATKITDSAITSVQNSINEMCIRIEVKHLFENTNIKADEISEMDTVSQFVKHLSSTKENIDSYQRVIDSLLDSNDLLQEELNKASSNISESSVNIAEGIAATDTANQKIKNASVTFSTYSKKMSNSMTSIRDTITSLSKVIDSSTADASLEELNKQAALIKKHSSDLATNLTKLYDAINAIEPNLELTSEIKADLLAKIDAARTIANGVADSMDKVTSATPIKTSLETTKNAITRAGKSVESIQNMLDDSITPSILGLMDSLSKTMVSLGELLNNLNDATGTTNDLLTGMGTTVDSVNSSMVELDGILKSTSETINTIITEIDESDYETQLAMITNLLGGSPDVMADFFSDPIQTEDNYLYQIDNYGSGVAPFYTTLAIWVGMTILVSLVKTNAKNNNLVNPKPHQLFFGRYILFFILSQIQAAVIVAGNLLIFHIQCLHPFLFWLACAVTSLTFSLLIYSLTISFGDLGKAAAVVIMVIQIAGSGGTYPIEALPSFFKAVYGFFPFPYAIDAMRECIGGMYENTYGKCLIYLALFCVASLIIGLVIRLPLISLNHYIEERMEDTEMM